MKATEIRVQIVKNLGNYETVRMEAVYSLSDGELVGEAIIIARKELEQSYMNAYKSDIEIINKRSILELESKELTKIIDRLRKKTITFEALKSNYDISDGVMEYLHSERLI